MIGLFAGVGITSVFAVGVTSLVPSTGRGDDERTASVSAPSRVLAVLRFGVFAAAVAFGLWVMLSK